MTPPREDPRVYARRVRNTAVTAGALVGVAAVLGVVLPSFVHGAALALRLVAGVLVVVAVVLVLRMLVRPQIPAGIAESGTWDPRVYPPPAEEVRIECSAMGPPTIEELALVALVGTPRWLPDNLRPRPTTKIIKRTLFVDPIGVRHVDAARLPHRTRLDFAVPWTELAHVSLQVVTSQITPLQMIRVVLWPGGPVQFALAHPAMAVLRDLPGLAPGSWALSLGVNDHVDSRVLDATGVALAHYSGGRFSGAVEQVWSPRPAGY